MTQRLFDAEGARRIESIYRIEDARQRRRHVREALGARPGERVLDVGCGPGFYCLELAGELGPAGSVVGVDGSPAMVELARRRCAELPNVELHQADATAIGLDDADFDAAICVQVLEYLHDPGEGLAELHRALRPGGRVLVWDIDWATLSMQHDESGLTERVLRAWDEHLADPSLPRTLGRRLRAAGFQDVRGRAHPLATVAFDPETYGAAIVPLIAGFVGGRAGVSEAEAAEWVERQRALDERGEFYFACTQWCFTAVKPA